jgi:hypothetical protein
MTLGEDYELNYKDTYGTMTKKGSWDEYTFVNYMRSSPASSKKTNKELAKISGVSERTISNWRINNAV